MPKASFLLGIPSDLFVDGKGFSGKVKLTIASNKANKVNTPLLQGNPLVESNPMIIERSWKQLLAHLVWGFMSQGAVAMMGVVEGTKGAGGLSHMLKILPQLGSKEPFLIGMIKSFDNAISPGFAHGYKYRSNA